MIKFQHVIAFLLGFFVAGFSAQILVIHNLSTYEEIIWLDKPDETHVFKDRICYAWTHKTQHKDINKLRCRKK